MEKLLARLAQQLDAIDEASLMSLWSKYATLTSRFEPTRQWEEAALIFSLIQSKRWKNQLFNFNWSRQRRPGVEGLPELTEALDSFFSLEAPAKETIASKRTRPCHILAFRPKEKTTQNNV